jgi:Fe-S-cluster containining protein
MAAVSDLATNESWSESATVNVEARLGNHTLQFSVTVPAGPTRLDELLPLLQMLSDNLVGGAEQEAQRRGQCISCRKGCGACCRQLVPLSPVDARNIARLVQELPEPRRTKITARFTEARRRLEEAGIWQRLEQRHAWPEGTSTEVGLEYFQLGIPCPFLEDESCSIHQNRPLSCREYLVTSPAENCARPTVQSIDWLPLVAKVWVAAARCEPAAPDAKRLNWVPLVQGLDWAAEQPESSAEKSGPEVLRQVIEGLGRSGSPPRSTAALPSSLPPLNQE